MTGQNIAAVLDADGALEQTLDQVAPSAEHHYDDGQTEPLPDVEQVACIAVVDQIADDAGRNDGNHATADAALPGLARRDAGEELVLTDERTDAVSARIVAPQQDEDAQWQIHIVVLDVLHGEGKDVDGRDVIGLYVLNEDNTCHLLCTDFDDKNCEHGYQEDVLAFVDVCKSWNIPYSIERSRSGNGAHVWIFFETPVLAVKARRMGNAILTEAMNRNGKIDFKSYDRFFPNQDTLPEGGLGNLVALPLQGQARKIGNSIFVNEYFEPFDDQWEYLQNMGKLSEAAMDEILKRTANILPLGDLSKTSETKPWEVPMATKIEKSDFSSEVVITRSNMLYIPLSNLSSKVLNHLRRIASFRNPEFYSKQALRLSTYSTPRIISCADLTDEYLALPRGCEDAVTALLKEKEVDNLFNDKTNHGRIISVHFNGELRENQQEAVNALSANNTGVLSATTAFGKTVTAIGLIAKLGVNTLILVHTKALLDQWVQRLEQFLVIDDIPEVEEGKRKQKKKQIQNAEQGYVVKDDIGTGYGIPSEA